MNIQQSCAHLRSGSLENALFLMMLFLLQNNLILWFISSFAPVSRHDAFYTGGKVQVCILTLVQLNSLRYRH